MTAAGERMSIPNAYMSNRRACQEDDGAAAARPNAASRSARQRLRCRASAPAEASGASCSSMPVPLGASVAGVRRMGT